MFYGTKIEFLHNIISICLKIQIIFYTHDLCIEKLSMRIYVIVSQPLIKVILKKCYKTNSD